MIKEYRLKQVEIKKSSKLGILCFQIAIRQSCPEFICRMCLMNAHSTEAKEDEARPNY